MHEHDILEGCRRGEREARWAFYSRTSERIYRLLVRLTGSHDAGCLAPSLPTVGPENL